MISIVNFLRKLAKFGVKYSLCSTQFDLPKEIASKILSWGVQNIPEEELYTEDPSMGREDNIHVTVFYGLTSDDPSPVGRILKDIKPFKVRLDKTSLFDTDPDYDVLKIDVVSPELIALNKKISVLPNKNKWPTYHPHCTIAYLKKGYGKKYAGKEVFTGEDFMVDRVIFSNTNNERITLPFKLT